MNIWAQWLVILATNVLFVCKYVPRAGLPAWLCAVVYGLITTGLFMAYRYWLGSRISEKVAQWLSLTGIAAIIAVIAGAIFLIDPFTIQVDRWSATSFFLDGLFNGVYPYGVHTHLCEENFPSPFPFWHYLNIPFWLLGDVGWIQVFFLLVFMGSVYYYFGSWKAVLLTVSVLCISPAYWWEIMTRSDGLSNALMVCSCVLIMEKKGINIERQWLLTALIAGFIASTRLSAIIPIALYLFRPWIEADWRIKLGFIAVALGVVLCIFAPYIFWDTETWVFFQRNPFMSQTTPGSVWILGIMVLIAIGLAYKKTTFYYYLCTTSVFMFAFMLFTQLGVIYRSLEPVTLFDICCDISYFTLALPYAIIALINPTNEHN